MKTVIALLILISPLVSQNEALAAPPAAKKASIAKKKAVAKAPRKKARTASQSDSEGYIRKFGNKKVVVLSPLSKKEVTSVPDAGPEANVTHSATIQSSPSVSQKEREVLVGENVTTTSKKKLKIQGIKKVGDDEAITDPSLRRALRQKAGEDLKRFSISPSYRMSTNLADQAKPRIYSHSLGVSADFQITPDIGSYISTDVQTVSMGREVRQDGYDQANLQDISIGSSFSILSADKYPLPLRGSIDLSMPFSEESRYEGYQGVASLSLNSALRIMSRLNLIPSVGITYIHNKFEFSPTTFETNTDYFTRASLQLTGRLGLGFSAGYRLGFSNFHYLDNTYTTNISNGISLAFSAFQGKVTASLGLSNGSYPDQSNLSFWFIDQYRRMLTFNLSAFF